MMDPVTLGLALLICWLVRRAFSPAQRRQVKRRLEPAKAMARELSFARREPLAFPRRFGSRGGIPQPIASADAGATVRSLAA